MNYKTLIKKVVYIAFVVLLFCVAIFVLQHKVKNGQKTTEYYPEVSDSPIYIECEQGKPLEVKLTPTQDFNLSALQVLLVNISSESQGSFQITVKDSTQSVLANEVVPINTINPGEWLAIPASVTCITGEEYTVSFLADGSEPYFMKLIDIESAGFPFEETVLQNGEPADAFVSMGINTVTSVNLSFGDILYYSRVFAAIAAVLAISFILLGKEKIFGFLYRIPFGAFLKKYGNDLFLILVFAFLGMQIISNAYLKGVYISADSSGYLREAVNIVNGNGFSYDGMAGYDSWFANWPIIYPAMIAFMMLITHTNAYLASKLLTILIVAVILVVLRIVMKKDAWIYSLCLLNIGFMNLTYYTWSEVPFILFLLIFSLKFGTIIETEKPKVKDYVLLGISGVCCFLTRYFGIYIWLVVGLYLLILFSLYLKDKNKSNLKKVIWLAITAFVSGCFSIGYMALNKIMNGMASGVSRGLWWDDYEILTNDLIESLLTEITNAFCIQIPQMLDSLPFNMKVWILLVLLVGILLIVKKKMRPLSRESVMLALGVGYYLIFIVIRYRSSMDSFYFRFFEPASFIICIALISLLIPTVKGKNGFQYFAAMVASFLLIIMVSMLQNKDMSFESPYYNRLATQWDQAYSEIPEKSVIIFNDIDFRSAFYRADVVGGTITPDNSFDSLKAQYYGSDYLCIRREYVETMLESEEYEQSVVDKLVEAVDLAQDNQMYIVIALN